MPAVRTWVQAVGIHRVPAPSCGTPVVPGHGAIPTTVGRRRQWVETPGRSISSASRNIYDTANTPPYTLRFT